MHRYRIITQIYLVFYILNVVLAAPVVIQKTHEARGGDLEMGGVGPAENPATMPNESDNVEVASDKPTSPSSSPNAMASLEHSPSLDNPTSRPSSPNEIVELSPSSDGSSLSHHSESHLSEPPSEYLAPVKKSFIKEAIIHFFQYLAGGLGAVGAYYGLRKFLLQRDYQDSDRGGVIS